MPWRTTLTPSTVSADSDYQSEEEEDVDLVGEAVGEFVESVRVHIRFKPHPVCTYLATSHYHLLKKSGAEIKCSICLDEIDCPNCFELWSCGHHLHRHCSSQLKKLRCPLCNVP